MLLIHPVGQFLAITLALYVFSLGFQRFRMLHLKQSAHFQWKRHVTLGTIVLLTLPVGLTLGLVMAYTFWSGILITGTHGKVALVMVPFVLFGLLSGIYLNFKKKKRNLLPLLHGLNNVVMLGLALSQIATGAMVFRTFVYPLYLYALFKSPQQFK